MSTEPPKQMEDELERVYFKLDDPAITSSEVAAELDITTQGAHKKLSKANEEGRFERKKVGARAVVWWPSGYSSNELL